jgi:hypothetical protein
MGLRAQDSGTRERLSAIFFATLQAFEAAARKLVSTGFLPPADLPRLLERCAAEWDFALRPPARAKD